MSISEVGALAIVALAGAYLLVLGAMSLLAPSRASRFLLGFAGSRTKHYAELFLRFALGAAFVLHAPRMLLSDVFNLFGWVLLVTTACLLLLPWRWHHRFARQAVSRATRHIALIGVASSALGGFILLAVVRGGGA